MKTDSHVPARLAKVRGTELVAGDTRERYREKIARITLDSMVQFVGLLDAQGTVLEINQVALDAGMTSISGDPARLQQVVWNLLANAIKFTPRGGRVQVRLGRVNSHVEIAVTDTGEGIAPVFLPHVFDRFRQADSSTTRAHGGLGLGLAIVRHLVELHGGTFHADSHGEGRDLHRETASHPRLRPRAGGGARPPAGERPAAPAGRMPGAARRLEGVGG